MCEEIYNGKIFSVEKRKYRNAAGKDKTADIVIHSGAVAMFPIIGDTVYLVTQWREAAKQELLEIPAGTLEENEDPLECAQRELQEEIGFKGMLTLQSTYFSSPGFCNQMIYHYLATDLKPSKLVADDSEEIEIVKMHIDDLGKAISQGKIMDAKTIIGYYLYLNGQ